MMIFCESYLMQNVGATKYVHHYDETLRLSYMLKRCMRVRSNGESKLKNHLRRPFKVADENTNL
jgi:hypothetical protein